MLDTTVKVKSHCKENKKKWYCFLCIRWWYRLWRVYNYLAIILCIYSLMLKLKVSWIIVHRVLSNWRKKKLRKTVKNFFRLNLIMLKLALQKILTFFFNSAVLLIHSRECREKGSFRLGFNSQNNIPARKDKDLVFRVYAKVRNLTIFICNNRGRLFHVYIQMQK